MKQLKKQADKPTLAVHKLTSCSGCQAVILNMGEPLLKLTEHVELLHFVEAGLLAPERKVDIALVEGSISTPADQKRLQAIRENSRLLIAIGACACFGGVQALRNVKNSAGWAGSVYPEPEHLQILPESLALSHEVKVDYALPGCPINAAKLLGLVRALLLGAVPRVFHEKLCLECKRQGHVCVLVTGRGPCLGPVTQAGCGALCPAIGAPCYGCFGPSEQANTQALAQQMQSMGLRTDEIAESFAGVCIGAPEFKAEYQRWRIPVMELSSSLVKLDAIKQKKAKGLEDKGLEGKERGDKA